MADRAARMAAGGWSEGTRRLLENVFLVGAVQAGMEHAVEVVEDHVGETSKKVREWWTGESDQDEGNAESDGKLEGQTLKEGMLEDEKHKKHSKHRGKRKRKEWTADWTGPQWGYVPVVPVVPLVPIVALLSTTGAQKAMDDMALLDPVGPKSMEAGTPALETPGENEERLNLSKSDVRIGHAFWHARSHGRRGSNAEKQPCDHVAKERPLLRRRSTL